eukprot:150980_1
MDISVYYEILNWRGEDPQKLDDANPGQQIGVSIFHQDILLNKAVWTNRKQIDFKYWLQSFHPLVGLTSAPPLHPYSKHYRLANLSFVLFIGALWCTLSCFYSLALFETHHGLHFRVLKLLLISLTNCLCIFLIEWAVVRTHCFKPYFKRMITLPACILVTVCIIAVLGCMVISLDFIGRFVFIFCFQLMMLWLFQFLWLYRSFNKQWKWDQQLIAESKGITIDISTRLSNSSSMVPVHQKIPYYIAWQDYTEFIAERQVDAMDISRSRSNENGPSDLVLGYTPPQSAIKEPFLTADNIL